MSGNPIHVCSFESRRHLEMARLIEKFGGVPTVAPSMQEAPLSTQPDVTEFANKLRAGEIDLTVFLTGVGVEALFDAMQPHLDEASFVEHLRQTTVAVRGPKPAAALAKREIAPQVRAPEPNTWQDLAAEIDSQGVELANKTVAIQEYGQPSVEFYDWLKERRAEPFPVAIYRWELPDDIEPLKAAIAGAINGEFELLLWTSAQQVVHVLEVAAQMGVQQKWIEAANRCVNASIGPTASARMRERGLTPAMEPTHPKMAHLVKESIEFCRSRQ